MKFVVSCMSMVALVAATSHTATSHTATHIAPPLFNGATESTWSVNQGAKSFGLITLLTSPWGTRAEFQSPDSRTTTFLGGNGTVWMRTGGEDTELSTISPMTVSSVASAALLLPFKTSKSDLLVSNDGKTSKYMFAGVQATYVYDGDGPLKVEIEWRPAKYTLTRQTFTPGSANANPSSFTIRPKKGAASRLARLSGDLMGSSDTSVSATAGPSGAGNKGLTLKDGGDYAAVLALENRDGHWKADAKLDKALTDFQKTGKVGKARDEQ